MPAFQINPTAEGFYTGWTNAGGATKVISVTDAVDGNYIHDAGGIAYQTFVLEDLPTEAVAIEGDVVGFERSRTAGTPDDPIRIRLRYSGTDADSTNISNTTSFTDYTKNFGTAPGAVPWTPTILNATEGGVVTLAAAFAQQNRCTRFYLYGNYTPAGGGFAFLVVGLVGGLLGASLMLADMPGIARAVAQARVPGVGVSIIQPHEYQRALDELKSHPFRRYSWR